MSPPARLGVAIMLGCAGLVAQAQFKQAPQPVRNPEVAPSHAATEREYRLDAARHLYDTYPQQVLKGMVPANVYAIMVTETEIDAQGRVRNVRVLRPPAIAKEVQPWVVSLIRGASPLPAPTRMGRVRYVEVWLVDESGQFQVHTLTEGQR